MTDDTRSPIAPPPSVDDVLSALTDQSRIGQVDFTASLGPDTPSPAAAVDASAYRPVPPAPIERPLRRVTPPPPPLPPT